MHGLRRPSYDFLKLQPDYVPKRNSMQTIEERNRAQQNFNSSNYGDNNNSRNINKRKKSSISESITQMFTGINPRSNLQTLSYPHHQSKSDARYRNNGLHTDEFSTDGEDVNYVVGSGRDNTVRKKKHSIAAFLASRFSVLPEAAEYYQYSKYGDKKYYEWVIYLGILFAAIIFCLALAMLYVISTNQDFTIVGGMGSGANSIGIATKQQNNIISGMKKQLSGVKPSNWKTNLAANTIGGGKKGSPSPPLTLKADPQQPLRHTNVAQKADDNQNTPEQFQETHSNLKKQSTQQKKVVVKGSSKETKDSTTKKKDKERKR